MSYSTSLRIGGQEFRPRLGLTLAATLVAMLCLALGVWQLQRAEEKAQLAALLSERVDQQPIAISDIDFAQSADLRFTRVELRGRYDFEHQFHIPHRRNQGVQGAHIITPLRIAGSARTLLVNRGWVANAQAGADLAPVTSDVQTVEVTGRLVSPAAPPLRLGPANSDATPWHRPWLFADPDLFSARSGDSTLPMVLLLDADVPDGYQRSWTLPQPDPSMHYGYAIQWFAFSAMALIVWAALSRKKERDE